MRPIAVNAEYNNYKNKQKRKPVIHHCKCRCRCPGGGVAGGDQSVSHSVTQHRHPWCPLLASSFLSKYIESEEYYIIRQDY